MLPFQFRFRASCVLGLALVVAGAVVAAYGQTEASAVWLGGGGNWTSSPNWLCSDGVMSFHCVPANDQNYVYDVVIGDNSFTGFVSLNMSPVVNSLTLGISNNGTLTIASNNDLTITDGMFVGYSAPGSGILNIGGSGKVFNQSDGYIGVLSGSVGSVSVSGSGSQWSNSGTLYIGDYGQGTVTISSGGAVNSNNTYLGFQPGSSGDVTVSGAGSQWDISATLEIGSGGVGAVNVNGGGAITTTGGIGLGQNAGSRGTAIVSGTGSLWTYTGGMFVGINSPGTVTVQNGAVVSGDGAALGYFTGGGIGTVTVTGTGSRWTNTSEVAVGVFSQGSITIASGGLFTSANGTQIGLVSGSNGSVTIDGPGSEWTYTQGIAVGSGGNGVVIVQNGGVLSGDGGQIGYNGGAVGTVTVTGAGSQWTNTGGLIIGGSGQGLLTIQNGGVVTSNGAYIGAQSGSSGRVAVTGIGSEWTNIGTLTIGQFGQGALTIQNGGTMVNGSGVLTQGTALTNWQNIYIENGSSLSVQGNVDNPGFITTLRASVAGSHLTMTGAFTVDAGGGVVLNDARDTANFGTLNNLGFLAIGGGAIVNLTNQPLGITDVAATSTFDIIGSFNNVLAGTSAFAQLTNVDGSVFLFNHQSTNITPVTGILTVGSAAEFDVGNASSAFVHGDVNNLGFVAINDLCQACAGSRLDVTGNFNNSSSQSSVLGLFNPGDVANLGTLTNNGGVYIYPGATLNLTNQPGGITDVVAGSTFDLAGIFNAGTNNGFYQLTSVEGNLVLEDAQTTTSTPIGGTFTVGSTGYVEVVSGTTFNINGNVVVNPGGIFSVNDPLPTTVNITGMLTNNGGQVNVVGPTAFLNVGGIGNGGTLTLPEGSTVNLANGFYQLASGTLGETIGAMGFSIISVNGGLVMLDGTLDVLLDPGFNPAVGSTYKFFLFSPGALSGTFASIQNDIFNGGTEKWVVVYNDAGGYVELVAASATPEPGTFLLLGTGLLGLAYGARRRWLG